MATIIVATTAVAVSKTTREVQQVVVPPASTLHPSHRRQLQALMVQVKLRILNKQQEVKYMFSGVLCFP